ncbi:hypothetical protein [Chitinibacter tainanensis]|uniref:hypothetical protein n=1 Tax=Chitinibacter tainanensis TaxID=230667 RepID=UPI00048DAEEE|nr:hypothetical protein [Chitinibacter tainanensis]
MQSSGPISLYDVSAQLGRAGQQTSFGDGDVRSLAKAPSGAYGMDAFYGKPLPPSGCGHSVSGSGGVNRQVSAWISGGHPNSYVTIRAEYANGNQFSLVSNGPIGVYLDGAGNWSGAISSIFRLSYTASEYYTPASYGYVDVRIVATVEGRFGGYVVASGWARQYY